MPTREQVMTAFLAQITTLNPGVFKTVSRRLIIVENGPTPVVATPTLQPAITLMEGDETTRVPNRGAPAIRTWNVYLLMWCKIPVGATIGVPDGATPGSQIINGLIEGVEGAINGPQVLDDTGANTLGGLVDHCWIEGVTTKVPGDMNPDGQCFAAIPVSILVP